VQIIVVKARAPFVQGVLPEATSASKLFDGHANVSLIKEAGDLLVGKSGVFHSRYFQY
jgi:hypothetical protein